MIKVVPRKDATNVNAASIGKRSHIKGFSFRQRKHGPEGPHAPNSIPKAGIEPELYLLRIRAGSVAEMERRALSMSECCHTDWMAIPPPRLKTALSDTLWNIATNLRIGPVSQRIYQQIKTRIYEIWR
jgi:hypothetical protein